MGSAFSSSLFFAHHFPWFEQQFLGEIVPRWQAGAPRSGGCFHVAFDRQWQSSDMPAATLVSQARLLFLFSQAYHYTKNTELRRLVVDGARFLEEQCADKERGGFCWSFAPDGTWVDTMRDSYGHAFVLLGLTHAFDITGDQAALNGALRALECLNTRFIDSAGLLAWKMTPAWEDLDSARSQNPVMHAVEAMMALIETLQRRKPILPSATVSLEQLIQSVRTRVSSMIQKLFIDIQGNLRIPLPENYDLDWKALAPQHGGLFMTGHQCEWAFLLSQAAHLGLGKHYLETGMQLIEHALATGCDSQRGIIWSAYDTTGAIRDRTLTWWSYSETIRALLRYGHDHNRQDLLAPCSRFIEFAQEHFIDQQYGGWFQTVDETGEVLESAKGSVWKLDYHQAGMCIEAMRLSAA